MSFNTTSISDNNDSALKSNDYLSCLQVVMVNTTLPANIGSAARAMHTMGLTRLSVVNPKHPIDETSIAHAAGGSDILVNAKIVDSLETAIKECQLVFAASSRSRHLPRPVVNPMQAAKIMLDFIDSQSAIEIADKPLPNIAILFGREDRGLTNEELSLADYHIQIDANPNYPVLNVASALQVIASFIFTYVQSHIANTSLKNSHNVTTTETEVSTEQPEPPMLNTQMIDTFRRQQWDEPAITQQQLQQLIKRTVALMVARNLADSEHLRSLPLRLSRLGSRLQLDQKEYQLLSALITKLLKQ